MAIESPTHINDLNPLWPADDETPQQGDDHLRLIKQVLIDDLGSLEGSLTLTAEQINGLVDDVAACVLKAGDTMSGDLKLINYKSVQFALADDSDVFARVIGRDDSAYIELLDSEGVVLNSIDITPAAISLGSVASGVTPDGTDAKGLMTVDYLSQILIVEDRKATGVAGGASSNTSWIQRDLNTKVYDGITGVPDITNDEITLPIGTYEIEGSAPAYKSDRHTIRLVDASGPTTLLIGTAEQSNEGDDTSTRSFISGVVTLAAETVLYIEHYTVWGDAAGLGVAVNVHGAGEVYTRVKFTKIS